MPWKFLSGTTTALNSVALNVEEEAPTGGALRQLMSATAVSAALGAAHAPALQEVVDQFARGIIHLHVERFHAAGQVVEHHNRRNRYKQSDGGGHQRFRNAAGDCRQSGCLFLGDTVKGVQNTDHRAEQSHEGSG